MYVSLSPSRPNVPWERMGHIPDSPIYHVYVFLRPSRPNVTWERMGHIPVCPVHHIYVCILTSILSQCTVGKNGTYPSLSHLPHVCMHILMSIPSNVQWERMGHIPVCPVYHMYVFLRLSRPIVPRKIMGHIPVCSIYHT